MATKKKKTGTPAKKAPAKKAPPKKAPPKKTAKKAPAKKTAKKAAKKTAKKAPAKKTAKKAPAKKTAKKAAKKAPPKKTAKKAGSRVRLRGTQHDPPVLLLVHLPMSLTPAVRAEKFEGPLEMALDELGTITGAGTSLDEDGKPESCDIEVEVNDVARALPIVRRILVEGGAAKGTLIARMSGGAEQDVEVLFEL